MHIRLLRHSWVHGGSKPNTHFWHLNSVKVQTQIVHPVALEELYKTAYLLWQSRHPRDAKCRDIRSNYVPTESTRTYQGNLPLRPSGNVFYNVRDSVFHAEHESEVSSWFWRKSDGLKWKGQFSPGGPVQSVVNLKWTSEFFSLDVFMSKDAPWQDLSSVKNSLWLLLLCLRKRQNTTFLD